MATESNLVLTPPEAVAKVEAEKAAGLVPLDDGQKAELATRARAFVTALTALAANSPEFGKKAEQLTLMGRGEIADAAGQSNRFLSRPVKAMDAESGVGADLAALRRRIEDLDPARHGNLLEPKKLLGLVPFGNKLRDYFDGY